MCVWRSSLCVLRCVLFVVLCFFDGVLFVVWLYVLVCCLLVDGSGFLIVGCCGLGFVVMFVACGLLFVGCCFVACVCV